MDYCNRNKRPYLWRHINNYLKIPTTARDKVQAVFYNKSQHVFAASEETAMPETVILYHNNRCSKSRAALSLLQLRGLKTKVVPYLDTPPDAGELEQLYRRLKLDSPRGMMRTKDALYRELALDNPALGEEALIAAMAEHPALIERPIAVFGQQAAIGRPLENIEAILPKHTS